MGEWDALLNQKHYDMQYECHDLYMKEKNVGHGDCARHKYEANDSGEAPSNSGKFLIRICCYKKSGTSQIYQLVLSVPEQQERKKKQQTITVLYTRWRLLMGVVNSC